MSIFSNQSKTQKPTVLLVSHWYIFLSGVRFTLGGTTYQNNSLVTLEDIGDSDDALLCMTDLTACCRSADTPAGMGDLGEWFFPNGTVLPNFIINADGLRWDFYRNRGPSVVRMNRRRGGVNGIYRCEIPVSVAPSVLYQTLYIGVYTASTGEWYRGFPGWLRILAAVANHSCG